MKKILSFGCDVDELVKFFLTSNLDFNTYNYKVRKVSEYGLRTALNDYFKRNEGRTDLTLSDLVYTMTHYYKFANSIHEIGKDCLALNWEKENKYAWDETEKLILAHEGYIEKILRSGKEWVACIFHNDRLKGSNDWMATAKTHRLRIKVRNVEVDDGSCTDDSASATVDFKVGKDKWIYRAFNQEAEAYGELAEYECGFYDTDGKSLTYKDLEDGDYKELAVDCKFVRNKVEGDKVYYKVVLVDEDRIISDWFIIDEDTLFNEIIGEDLKVEVA